MIQDRILHPPYMTDGDSDVDYDERLFRMIVLISNHRISSDSEAGGEHGFGYAELHEIRTPAVNSGVFTKWAKIPSLFVEFFRPELQKIVNAGLVTHSPPYGIDSRIILFTRIHLTKKGYELWYAPIKRLEEERTERAKATADAKLLRAAEAAVEAKAEAEANPDDPLSWLRMAEAMDAANRHEEAERCRKTAMELMEK